MSSEGKVATLRHRLSRQPYRHQDRAQQTAAGLTEMTPGDGVVAYFNSFPEDFHRIPVIADQEHRECGEFCP
ncbi:MAG: hypothetical protein RLZZ232_3656 [Planctomycetota bacterium]|jgi:hypothetical protein